MAHGAGPILGSHNVQGSHLTPVAKPFWPQMHNLNKLGRGFIPNIRVLGLMVSDKKLFHVLP